MTPLRMERLSSDMVGPPERDPLELLAEWLIGEGLADQAELDRIRADVGAEIGAGVRFASEAPYPEPEEVDQHVFA